MVVGCGEEEEVVREGGGAGCFGFAWEGRRIVAMSIEIVDRQALQSITDRQSSHLPSSRRPLYIPPSSDPTLCPYLPLPLPLSLVCAWLEKKGIRPSVCISNPLSSAIPTLHRFISRHYFSARAPQSSRPRNREVGTRGF